MANYNEGNRLKSNRKVVLQKGKGAQRKQAKLAYLYEKESRYFAQLAEDIKGIAIEELKFLGAEDVKPVFRGAWFKASKKDFYRITYFSRLASRILAPLITFDCHDKNDLYKAAKQIHWEELLTPRKTFSITANVSDSAIEHSNYAGLRIKDAIADYFRDRTNKRPSVDPKSPYLGLNLHIHKTKATLSVDASGGPMHKRGYREASISAPMQETVAASIIRFSDWDGEKPLFDPMCGSGTLLCEALMAYCRIPSQIFKTSFGFERLPDFEAGLWEQVKKEAQSGVRPLEQGMIFGSDKSEESVEACKTNVMGLHFGREILISQSDFKDAEPAHNRVIVTNPPYGIRMGKKENMNQFYKDFGVFLKEKCRQSIAYVYFGDPKFIKKVPLAPAWKKPLKIGGLAGKLVKYEIY